MTELTNEQIKERRFLEVLEERAHKALVRVEGGWREFAATMRQIKGTGSYKEKGYKHFGSYYRDVWEERAGRTWETTKTSLRTLRAIEEFEAAAIEVPELRQMPQGESSRLLLNAFADPAERVKAWEHHLKSGRPMGAGHAGLQKSIAEKKAGREPGVIEQMHEDGVPLTAYPTGPTPEEQAYNAASQLLSLAMDVTPEAAADSISPGLAQTTAPRYGVLVPWVRRFVAQLQLRASGGR